MARTIRNRSRLPVIAGVLCIAASASSAQERQRGQEQQDSGRVVHGVLLDLSEDQITIRTDDDSHRTFRIERETEVERDGREISAERLREGERVRVRTERDDRSVASSIRAARPENGRERHQAEYRVPEDAPALGVLLMETGERCARVAQLLPDGPAQGAGLEWGDQILAIDGEPVTSCEDLSEIIAQREPGDEVRLRVRRNGEVGELTARLQSRGELFGPEYGADGEELAWAREEELAWAPEDEFADGEMPGMHPMPAMMEHMEMTQQLLEQNERIEMLLRRLTRDVRTLQRDVQELQQQAGGLRQARQTPSR